MKAEGDEEYEFELTKSLILMHTHIYANLNDLGVRLILLRQAKVEAWTILSLIVLM